jgi:hypothetical protein
VALSRDTHPNDDEAVVRMGYPALLYFVDGDRIAGESAFDGDVLAGVRQDGALVGDLEDLAIGGDEDCYVSVFEALPGAHGVVLHAGHASAGLVLDEAFEDFRGSTGRRDTEAQYGNSSNSFHGMPSKAFRDAEF